MGLDLSMDCALNQLCDGLKFKIPVRYTAALSVTLMSSSRSRSRSTKAECGSNTEEGDDGSVNVRCCWVVSGEYIATCKVDADASLGQLKARLKAQLGTQQSLAAAVSGCSVLVEGTCDKFSDDFTKIMNTKVVKDAIKTSENGERHLSVFVYVM